MQRYTLVDRPVILSENKRNVIPHGRPLTPIGTVRSARPFFVPRQVKAPFVQENHGDTPTLKLSHSAPTTSLVQYHKSAHENLMTINNNLSCMLKESFAGIDSICQKVRLCLLEANTIKKPENLESLLTIKQTETCHVLSTCEEEEDYSNATNDDVPDITEDQELADIVEEIDDENANLKENEKEEQKENDTAKKPKKNPSLIPFFTILNPNTQEAESVGVNMIKSMSSKVVISRKCTAESFHKTMKEVEKLTNYEKFLTNKVDEINKEIDQYYSKYPKTEGETKRDDDKNKPNRSKQEDEKKDSRPSSIKCKRRGNHSPIITIAEDLKRYHEIKKINRDLMEDQFSENDLTGKDSQGRRHAISLYSGQLNFTCPDVYRKRAITDLHKRLEAQVEANDSLIFFQKLMARNRKYMKQNRPISAGDTNNEHLLRSDDLKSPMQCLLPQPLTAPNEQRKQRSLADLSKKYQDSLWFRQKKHELKRSKKESPPQKKRRQKKASEKKETIVPKSYTVQSALTLGNKPHKNGTKNLPQASPCNCKIKVTNDQPISDAQKCKLHWMRAKYSQLSHKKLKYLDILDDITKNDLLPIKAEYPRRDRIKSNSVKDSYLYKLMYGKNKDTENAWEQLFQPTIKCSEENCEKCNATTTILNKEDPNNQNVNLNSVRQSNEFPGNPSPIYNLKNGEVVRKLSKYIFFEDQNRRNPNQVFTVMPVHVFYDNSRVPTNNRRISEITQKLPLIPMKETKDLVKKAEWNETIIKRTKPMRVVYDPILRKIDKEIRMVSARGENKTGTSKLGQTSSWSPKSFSQYCSPNRYGLTPYGVSAKIDHLDKIPQKQKTVSSTRTPPMGEIFRRSPKASSEKMSHHPTASPFGNSPTLDASIHQKDNEVKQKIQKTINCEALSRLKSEQQRKIWENKYGKSVGQKLLSFIEKQPVPYQTPVPKYALPKSTKNPSRQRLILEQLRTLKQKNDNIQTNIQKAIEVIENKMVDILSKPATSESIEAFDDMEKEITSVLNLMKTSTPPKSGNRKEKLEKVDEYGHEVHQISDELFRRLDRILESGVSSSGRSSKNSLQTEGKVKRKSKLQVKVPPQTTDMNKVCFSSASTSGEEKFTITAISPKRVQLPNPTITPFIKTFNATDAIPEGVATIKNELKKLENELVLSKKLDVNQSNATKEPDTIDDNEVIQENASMERNAMLKNRTIVPVQSQIVNIALFEQTKQRSSGDQLNELNKLLEQDLKSIDLSEDKDKTHSMALSMSQGDVLETAKKEEGTKNSGSIASEDELGDMDKAFGEKEAIPTTQEEKKKSACSSKSMDQQIKQKKTTQKETSSETKAKGKSKEIPKNYQEAAVLKQNVSQLSIDVTGPYFTPQASPLSGTRGQIDDNQKQICPVIEEEKHSPRIDDKEDQIGQIKHIKDDKKQLQIEDNFKIKSQTENGQEQRIEDESKDTIQSEDKQKLTNGMDKEGEIGEESGDEFYKNVNKIISRVENVYNQLEEFEEEMRSEELQLQSITPAHKIAVFKEEPPEISELEADMFLTPFMHAVKDLRKTVSEKADSRQSSPRLPRSPSFYNVLSFLDNLADFKEERPVEVHTSRALYSAHLVNIPQTFHQSSIYHLTAYSAPPINEEPRKKSGCLKNPSSHSNMGTVASKSKPKVSFLLQKEEKATQVTACPFHSVVRILSQQKISTDTLVSIKRDEQVSAYLDARENKSVDKMSINDDEATCLSTFELSDEISSDKVYQQMPEQVVQQTEENTDNQKKVVELFRNSSTEENYKAVVKVFSEKNDRAEVKGIFEETNGEAKEFSEEVKREEVLEFSDEPNREQVKVFYDTFETGQDKIDSKFICGFYNEDSILQVKQSLSKDLSVKKRDSLEKLTKNLGLESLWAEILKESSLFEPLKNLNKFVDSKLLKEAIEKRQKIRTMRRKSSHSLILASRGDSTEVKKNDIGMQGEGEKENLLKGFYVFVYLLMFTALNLEYKCVQ